MPNGGQHFERIKICPHCKSWRIHKRRGFHLLGRWRCRKCHKAFFTPDDEWWIFQSGTEPWKGLLLIDNTDMEIPTGRMRKISPKKKRR